jgi:hypothetical protein
MPNERFILAPLLFAKIKVNFPKNFVVLAFKVFSRVLAATIF